MNLRERSKSEPVSNRVRELNKEKRSKLTNHPLIKSSIGMPLLAGKAFPPPLRELLVPALLPLSPLRPDELVNVDIELPLRACWCTSRETNDSADEDKDEEEEDEEGAVEGRRGRWILLPSDVTRLWIEEEVEVETEVALEEVLDSADAEEEEVEEEYVDEEVTLPLGMSAAHVMLDERELERVGLRGWLSEDFLECSTELREWSADFRGEATEEGVASATEEREKYV